MTAITATSGAGRLAVGAAYDGSLIEELPLDDLAAVEGALSDAARLFHDRDGWLTIEQRVNIFRRAASRSRARSRRTPISSRKRRSTDTTGTPAGRAWRDQPVRRQSWHAKARVRKGHCLSLVAFRKNERVGPLTTRAAPRTAPSPVSPVPQNRSV